MLELKKDGLVINPTTKSITLTWSKGVQYMQVQRNFLFFLIAAVLLWRDKVLWLHGVCAVTCTYACTSTCMSRTGSSACACNAAFSTSDSVLIEPPQMEPLFSAVVMPDETAYGFRFTVAVEEVAFQAHLDALKLGTTSAATGRHDPRA